MGKVVSLMDREQLWRAWEVSLLGLTLWREARGEAAEALGVGGATAGAVGSSDGSAVVVGVPVIDGEGFPVISVTLSVAPRVSRTVRTVTVHEFLVQI